MARIGCKGIGEWESKPNNCAPIKKGRLLSFCPLNSYKTLGKKEKFVFVYPFHILVVLLGCLQVEETQYLWGAVEECNSTQVQTLKLH